MPVCSAMLHANERVLPLETEVQLALDEQLRRADAVVHGVIVSAELIPAPREGHFLRCGIKYRLRPIDERRLGRNDVVEFWGYRQVLVGAEVLALLEQEPTEPQQNRATRAHTAPAICSRPRLRLSEDHENLFEVVELWVGKERTVQKKFLLFNEARTLIPAGVQGVELAGCDPGRPACVISRPSRVPWTNISRMIEVWRAQ